MGGGVVGRAVVGAMASKLAGGRAGDGAMVAAFDYLFNWLPHVHAMISRTAGWKFGLSDGAAVKIALATADVAGTIGTESFEISQATEHAHWHGMCSSGDSAVVCDLKVMDYRSAALEAKSREGLGRYLHSFQDEGAPMHQKLPYARKPWYLAWADIPHAWSDRTPSRSDLERLVTQSHQLIGNYNSYCGGCVHRGF